MKYKWRTLMVAGIFSLFMTNASGQKCVKIPAWVCEDGYWVAESNIHSPRQHTIWFYNNDNVLVGRKDISGKRLNTSSKKTRLQLKEALNQSLAAWAQREKQGGSTGMANR